MDVRKVWDKIFPLIIGDRVKVTRQDCFDDKGVIRAVLHWKEENFFPTYKERIPSPVYLVCLDSDNEQFWFEEKELKRIERKI